MIHAAAWLTVKPPFHGIEDNTAELLPISCGYRSADLNEQPNYTIDRPNGRLDYQLIYVQSGAVSFTIDAASFLARAGQVVIIRPHTAHSYQYEQDQFCAVSWLHCTGRCAEKLLLPLAMQPRPVITVGQSKRLTELFQTILSEMQRKDAEYIGISTALTMQLLYYTLRKRSTQAESLPRPHDDRIDMSISIMSKQYMRAWTCEELAASVNLSTSRYIHLFTQIYHISPLKFLNNIRMNMAQEFLGVHSLSISEVSRMCGFRNQQYFCRSFRKFTGVTPSQYRSQSEG